MPLTSIYFIFNYRSLGRHHWCCLNPETFDKPFPLYPVNEPVSKDIVNCHQVYVHLHRKGQSARFGLLLLVTTTTADALATGLLEVATPDTCHGSA